MAPQSGSHVGWSVGAENVGMRGESRHPPVQEPGRAAEPFVGQRAVEGHDHRLRIVFVDREPRFGEGGDDRRHAQKIDPPDLRVLLLQVVDRVVGRKVEVARRDGDPHLRQPFDVLLHAVRGVVGEKGVPDAAPGEEVEEGAGRREKGSAVIDGSVHIQKNLPDAGEARAKIHRIVLSFPPNGSIL